MDSENIYHFHQNQLIGSPPLLPPPSSSSSLPTSSSCHGLASSSSSHTCTPTPNVTLSASNSFNQSYSGVILNSNSPMIQQSAGLPWFNNCHHPAHEHFSKINLEFSSDSFPKLTEMLNSPPSNIDDHSDLTATSCYLKNNIEEKNSNDVSDDDDKLLLKTNDQFSAGDFYSSFGSAKPISGNFSQIYPSINISNLISQSSSETSSNMNNLQALDLLESARLFGGNFRQPSHDNNLGLYKKSLPFGFDHHLQQSSSRPSCSPKNKISHFTNSGGEIIITEATKRPSGLMQQPKAKQSASNKKTRLESSGASSCPPLKVRKEKLGDRIAALQQMIAPFGKTDTASVLMEAIGYIKFLENQVETLSVPYMKSSRRNKSSSRTMQESTMVAEKNGDDEKPKRDLRSRGLCLVPLSCMSFITNDAGNEGIWPPPNFGGGGTF